jgi:hypothetical protein
VHQERVILSVRWSASNSVRDFLMLIDVEEVYDVEEV